VIATLLKVGLQRRDTQQAMYKHTGSGRSLSWSLCTTVRQNDHSLKDLGRKTDDLSDFHMSLILDCIEL
jgi:hypothetical protein